MTRKTLLFSIVGLLVGSLVTGCVIKENPCADVTCSGFGECIEDANGDAMCECDANYHAEGLQCIFDGYSISVEWDFGPEFKSCTEVQVTNVFVQLLENDVEVTSTTVNCQVGGVDIEGVMDGFYSVALVGLNNSGEEWYRAYVDVQVAGFNEDLGVVNLEAFGFMEFSWVFGTEQWDCLTAGVDRVRVEVWTTDEATNLFTANPIPDCEDLGAIITNWDIGAYNLLLEGICESDLSTGYVLDANVEILYPGQNDYGPLILDDVGGCL